jgi:hypothetical protein
MNELIKHLALECHNPYSNFDHEKFAKLVAEECAKLCDLYAMPDGTSETAIILGRAIRSKFGVDNE